MQGFVKPHFFLFLGDPDRPPCADDLEDDDGHHERVHRHDDHAEKLHEELMDAGVHLVDVAAGKDAEKQGAGDAAHAMGAPYFKGVVEPEAFLHILGVVAHSGTHGADDDRGPRFHVPGAGGNGGEAGDRADEHAGEGRLPIIVPVEKHPYDHGDGASDGRVGEGIGGQAVGRVSAARVEAEPAEPQEAGAHGDQRQVVGDGRLAGLHVVTPSEENDRGECRKTGADVDHDTARKVHNADLGKEAAAPDPMADGDIDKDHPQDEELQVAAEV